MLFHAFGTTDIVYFPQFRIGENLVGFADLGEFICSGIVAGVLIGVVFLGKSTVGLLQVPFRGGFV